MKKENSFFYSFVLQVILRVQPQKTKKEPSNVKEYLLRHGHDLHVAAVSHSQEAFFCILCQCERTGTQRL